MSHGTSSGLIDVGRRGRLTDSILGSKWGKTAEPRVATASRSAILTKGKGGKIK